MWNFTVCSVMQSFADLRVRKPLGAAHRDLRLPSAQAVAAHDALKPGDEAHVRRVARNSFG
jgi:hypothetical protein